VVGEYGITYADFYDSIRSEGPKLSPPSSPSQQYAMPQKA
jgi:hypothetical protein